MTIRPPIVGPATEARAVTPPMTPSAAPRRSAGKIEVTITSACGERIAAATPWTTRATINWVASCESPQAAEARVKSASPPMKSVRWPKMSPRRPPVTSSTATVSR